jgi:hypothetical protein
MQAHWNNSPWIYMSPHSDTLFWFRVNQSLLFLLATAHSAEKQQSRFCIYSLVWSDWDSNPRSTSLEANTLKITWDGVSRVSKRTLRQIFSGAVALDANAPFFVIVICWLKFVKRGSQFIWGQRPESTKFNKILEYKTRFWHNLRQLEWGPNS